MGDKPEIGLVIRHVYLWRDEQKQGADEGRKARPCLIVHKRQNEYDEAEVFICPITHTPPTDPRQAKEIPLKTKQRLKLDDDRSWVITSEVNRFIWKGPDVRKTQSGEFAYGFLPHTLIKDTITQFRENARQRILGIVDRDDQTLLDQMRNRRFKQKDKG
ncbi:MAG: type II toxin-antitoxin system PemK/MazF family toxin [Pseudomonadota bacterium]